MKAKLKLLLPTLLFVTVGAGQKDELSDTPDRVGRVSVEQESRCARAVSYVRSMLPSWSSMKFGKRAPRPTDETPEVVFESRISESIVEAEALVGEFAKVVDPKDRSSGLLRKLFESLDRPYIPNSRHDSDKIDGLIKYAYIHLGDNHVLFTKEIRSTLEEIITADTETEEDLNPLMEKCGELCAMLSDKIINAPEVFGSPEKATAAIAMWIELQELVTSYIRISKPITRSFGSAARSWKSLEEDLDRVMMGLYLRSTIEDFLTKFSDPNDKSVPDSNTSFFFGPNDKSVANSRLTNL